MSVLPTFTEKEISMPKRYKEEMVPADQLRVDPNFKHYEPFMDAFMKHMEDPAAAERRSVPAKTVGLPAGREPNQADVDGFCPGIDAFNELRRSREEMMYEIPVLERHDGSLWAYDDPVLMNLYHRYAPDAKLIVAIIGKDPDRGENRKKGVSTSRR